MNDWAVSSSKRTSKLQDWREGRKRLCIFRVCEWWWRLFNTLVGISGYFVDSLKISKKMYLTTYYEICFCCIDYYCIYDYAKWLIVFSNLHFPHYFKIHRSTNVIFHIEVLGIFIITITFFLTVNGIIQVFKDRLRVRTQKSCLEFISTFGSELSSVWLEYLFWFPSFILSNRFFYREGYEQILCCFTILIR